MCSGACFLNAVGCFVDLLGISMFVQPVLYCLCANLNASCLLDVEMYVADSFWLFQASSSMC